MFDPNGLCVYDPIIQFIWRISQGKKWRILLLAVGINSFCCLGLGALVAFFSGAHQVLSPFQAQTVVLECFIYIVTLPTVWIYYVWEPQRIIDIFNGLSKNGVVEQNKDQIYSTVEEFFESQIGTFNKSYYSLLSLFITIIMFLLWASTVFTPRNPFWFQYPQVWWEVNPIYFWLVWVPLVWVSVYMVFYTFVRRTITVILITRFLKAFTLAPKLFHPDRANGLSPVGNYPISFTLLTLVAGIWIFLVIAYPLFFGKGVNFKYDTIIYIILYIILTSVGLIAPTWQTHLAMRTAKFQALEVVAIAIRRLLAQVTPGLPGVSLPIRGQVEHVIMQKSFPAPKDIVKNIEALEWEYHLLEREYHTWPFNITSLNRFLVGTLFPLLLSGISIVLPLFIK